MSLLMVLLIVLVVLLGVGGAGVVFFVYRRSRSFMPPSKPKIEKPVEPPKPVEVPKVIVQTPGKPLAFRWTYVALPVIILVITVILTAAFFPRLPEQVAYRFADGKPEAFVSRGTVVAVGLGIQVFLAGISAAIVWGVSKSRVLTQSQSTFIDPHRVLGFMGNMVAMPQAIFCFALADIFSYNSSQVHLFPVWIFAVVVMLVGGMALGGMFLMTIMRNWTRPPR